MNKNNLIKEAIYYGDIALSKKLPDPREKDLDPWEYGHSFGYRIMNSEGTIIAEDNFYDDRYCPLQSHIIYENMIVINICDTGD